MDLSRFKETKTGIFVPITTPTGSDHAFIPDKLPPNWNFSSRLWPKLAEAWGAIRHLDGIGKTLRDPELLLSPLKRREAIASSRIEGTYATAQELMLFEISPHESKSAHSPVNAWIEVHNYSKALARGTERLIELPFCGKLIKELHGVLMEGVRGQHSRRGEYRDHQVAIGSDRRYVPPPKPEMEKCMDDFEKYINSVDNNCDALVRSFIVHYQFEAIHPFGDGNGRIGRVILSLMIAKWCKLSRPWLYMSAFFERWKDEYVDNLFRVSTEGAWEKWIEFCLNGTIQQATDAANRCEKLGNLKEQMLDRARSDGSPRTEQIVHLLFSNPIIRVSQLTRRLKKSYPTTQSDVDRLVKAKILYPLPDIRPKTYYCPEIMAIAYQDEFKEPAENPSDVKT
jgi:cell filamentation protein, protein adenylyltransferase